MNSWRAALRVARRSARRSLGRSLLIIALIALPVAGLTVVDGLFRTLTDRGVEADRLVGAADVRIDVISRSEHPADINDYLPPGSRAVPVGAKYFTGSLRLAVDSGIVRSRLEMVVLGDPLTDHIARLVSGRAPESPDEALVTEPLAGRLGLLDGDGELRAGATLRPENGPEITVTGLAVQPYCLSCADIITPMDTLLTEAMIDGSPLPLGYLVDLPDGTDVAALASTWPPDMFWARTPESLPAGRSFRSYVTEMAGEPVTLFAGLGVLGIVVTAGAAFAVGARRQTRELGLVAVNGGSAKHVRRIVLAQGLVLGVFGAASGLVLGGIVTVLGVPQWERMTDQLIENLRFGWLDLLAVAAVGILASLAAATVPAFAVARMHPVDALSGRPRAGTPSTRPSILGLFLIVAGTGAVVAAAVVARGRVAENRDMWAMNNAAPPLDQTSPVVLTLAGTVLTVLGLVLVMPALVTAVSRLGGRLPLSGRLAVRDAARHRHRTVAAGTAVMVTVAGSIVAAFVFAARVDSEPRTLPDNTAIAYLDGLGIHHGGQAQLDRTTANMTAAVPGTTVLPIEHVSADPNGPDSGPLFLEERRAPTPDCESNGHRLGLGTPDLITLSTGRPPDARVRAALAEGKIVVFGDCLVGPDDTVSLSVNLPHPTIVPAYHATPAPGTEGYNDLPTAFISPEAAAAQGWGPYADSLAVTYPSPDDLDAIRAAAANAGTDLKAGESADRAGTSFYLVLAGVAALVALLGAGVTVALSAADGRSDLATLAALGGSPGRRRTLAGAHALVITALGALAGLALGVCTGQAAVPVAGLPVLAVPWQHLALTTFAVPLLACVVAALATPSRLPMIARQET